MISRYNASVDGVPMNSLHNMLQVLDIEYYEEETQYSTARMASGSGVYATNPYRQSTSVTITFELHLYNTQERQRVCQSVAKWARGSILNTSDRPGQRLRIGMVSGPVISSVQIWNDPLTVTFTAYAPPFWEEEYESSKSVSNGSDTLYVPGNVDIARTKVDAEITANAALTSLTVGVGSTQIALSGISIPKNGKIIISHDANGHIVIKYGNTSLLNKRTGSDDLLADSGKINTVSVTGNAQCKFSVRGLWL